MKDTVLSTFEQERRIRMSSPAFSIECPEFDDFLKENQSRYKEGGPQNFAHPIDAGMLRVLGNPEIHRVFANIVRTSVNATNGLALATGLRVDEKDPDIRCALWHCAETLRISIPFTIVSPSVTGLNAYTIGTDADNYIVIGSLLKKLLSPEEMCFVLGHECGHIALGHVIYHTALRLVENDIARIPLAGGVLNKAISFPILGWNRCSEISADRAGLLCCGDVDTACRTLLRLKTGFNDIYQFEVESFIRDTKDGLERASIGKLGELFLNHPLLSKRMEALLLFARSEKYYRISGQTPPTGEDLIDDETLNIETENVLKVF